MTIRSCGEERLRSIVVTGTRSSAYFPRKSFASDSITSGAAAGFAFRGFSVSRESSGAHRFGTSPSPCNGFESEAKRGYRSRKNRSYASSRKLTTTCQRTSNPRSLNPPAAFRRRAFLRFSICTPVAEDVEDVEIAGLEENCPSFRSEMCMIACSCCW